MEKYNYEFLRKATNYFFKKENWKLFNQFYKEIKRRQLEKYAG